MITVEEIKKLREETGLSIMQCKSALEEAGGDKEKALSLLKKKGVEIASKKGDRVLGAGVVVSYIHSGETVGVMLELLCETDFVAKTDEFKYLAHEIAMQIAAMDPKDVATVLKQEYIRDSSMTIEQLVKSLVGKLGENIAIGRFQRFSI